jgi:peptide methionine sulfoxide reductase msrA/msrB
MRSILLMIVAGILIMTGTGSAQDKPKLNPLTPEEEAVIVRKGTERPFTGKYYRLDEKGTYLCKQCGAPLYRSESKFDAGCGWPSFDTEIPGAVRRVPDADGMRTEIVCARCGAHLGHVFQGEGFTPKDTRHCVNSISLNFLKDQPPAADPATSTTSTTPATSMTTTSETAIFASGCFWGTQYMLDKADGVISTRVGYTGGTTLNPTYEQVCSGTTGHVEATEVVFDPAKISYEKLARLFFETHDPTQANGQGPDIGEQYHSVIFYKSDAQQRVAEKLIEELRAKGVRVATRVEPAGIFWPAEGYHQKYYEHKGTQPYCHFYRKLF